MKRSRRGTPPRVYFFVSAFCVSSLSERSAMITVNGKEVLLSAPVTVGEYLAANQYQASRIAVEQNGAILPKSEYASALLADGDRLEIVSFVGGG